MNRPKGIISAHFLNVVLLALLVMTAGEASATDHSFGAGSYIIPADSCWQPNNDTANTIDPLPTYCDPNKDDKSLFQLFGALYALLDTGDDPATCTNSDGSTPQQRALFGMCQPIKVYWIIKPGKTSTNDADLDLVKVGNMPIVQIMNSAKTNSDPAGHISYSGGPFVIDGNDITADQMEKLRKAFPSVKIHKSNVPFSGNADKILIGKPPRVAVLNEGASDVLEDYIRSAGLFSWRNTVFQYVSQADVMNGCLDKPIPDSCKASNKEITVPFTLLWAPHWIVSGTAAEQKLTISKIRDFLQAGNSGFFECASIESIEGSLKTLQTGQNVGTAGGFLVGSAKAAPRLDTNGGCSDNGRCSADYKNFEQPSFWLLQCGGWNFEPTGGHVHNMRPTMDTSYTYLTTLPANSAATAADDRYVGSQLTRFIHDDPAKLNNAYVPQNNAGNTGYYVYDYLAGGRINGSPGEGYVIYMPGHKFISCGANVTSSYPPSRTLDFIFSTDPSPQSIITIEVVHDRCTKGKDCPTVQYDMAAGEGTRSTIKGDLVVSAEMAAYDTGNNRLSGVQITNSNTDSQSGDLKITGIYVSISGDTTTKLMNIADVTESFNRQSLCAPLAVSPASCTANPVVKPETHLSLTFSKNITAGKIEITFTTATGSFMASYDVGTKAKVSNHSADNMLAVDMTYVAFDPATYTLSDVIVKPGTANNCAEVTITDIKVKFPVAENLLNLIYNDTRDQEVCAPKAKTDANCSGVITPPFAIATELSWAGTLSAPATTPPADAVLKINYTCKPACGTTSITAKRGEIQSNADVSLDFKNISVAGSKLSNIKLTFGDRTKTYLLQSYLLAYTGSTPAASLVSYRDTTTNKPIFSVKTMSAPTLITKRYTVPPAPAPPASNWSYLFGKGICGGYYVSPYLSDCAINWGASNTCGIKYVLNTLLALKYMSIDSEYSKTQPLATSFLANDNKTVLYKASYDYPSYRGHLKMMKVPSDTQANAETVWDAATAMPPAGTANFPVAPLSGTVDNSVPRYIFTTLSESTDTIRFDPVSFQAQALADKTSFMTQLGIADPNETLKIINQVRGRKGVSLEDIHTINSCTAAADNTADLYGCDDEAKRLWAIENSTPALKTKSRYVESTAAQVSQDSIAARKDRRDRILFVGADDGMLHAFWAGAYDPVTGTYLDDATGRGTGKEIWAYIPSGLLPYLKDQPFNPDPTNVSNFEPKVAVDGSPALGDFLICAAKNNDTCTKWEWRTRLVGTAEVRGDNSTSNDRGKKRAIVFALDVTDPYNPRLLWEYTYDKTTDASCSGTSRNCNMGNSRGVAIGTAQIGSQLKDYVFLTSSWIDRKKATTIDVATNEQNYQVCTPADLVDPAVTCVYGVSAYALDLDTGKVMWVRSLPYTADTININEVPAVPALMDRDNNGSYDYVVFGDMQGRLWALRTTDGKNLTDKYTAINHASIPVYQVKVLDATGKDTSTPTNSKEPIGAPVSIYRDYVVLATGGADQASNGSANDAQTYRVEVVKIGIDGGVKDDNQTIVLQGYDAVANKGSEKVWAKPAITSDLMVYVATARSYYSNKTVATLESDGRVLVMDLKSKRFGDVNATNATTRTKAQGSNVFVVGGADKQWHAGGFVGGFDFDRKHAYVVTLKPTDGKSVLQIGPKDDFSATASTTNPFKVLWWRKM